jgi:hypothetical protein
MNIRCLLLGIGLCAALSPFVAVTKAHAQAAILVALFGDRVASENFFFSLKGGLNWSSLDGLDGTSVRRGPNFGMLATIRLNDRWSIVPEFAPLSVKGAEDITLRPTGNPELDNLLASATSSQSTLKYIDIPVVVQFRPHPRGYVGAGPQVAYLLSAKDTFRAKVNEDDDLSYDENIKDAMNSWEFGLVIEAGFVLLPTRQGPGLTLYGRYARGLNDIVKDNDGDAVYTSVWQFGLSLPFLAKPSVEDE